MAKQKNAVKKSTPRHVPYATQLATQRAAQTQALRRETELAVRTQLLFACVALNDSEGFGLQRITRFADAMAVWTKDWKADPERTLAHAQRRLEKLGFCVDGLDIIAFTDDEGKPIRKDQLVELPSITSARQCADGLESILDALNKLNDVLQTQAVKTAACYVNQAIDELQEIIG